MKAKNYILILLVVLWAMPAFAEPNQRIETIRIELDALEAELAEPEPNYNPADINRDGMVGAADLAILAANWGWPNCITPETGPTEDPNEPVVVDSNWPPVGDALMKAPYKAVEYAPTRERTWPVDMSSLRPGDLVVFPPGTYIGSNVIGCSGLKGEPNAPIVFLADPNGPVILDGESSGILVKNYCSDLVFDGFEIVHHGATGQGGIYGFYASNITFRNIEISGWNRGIFMMEDLHGITIENCTIHDNLGSHGIYLGARGRVGSDITVRRNVIYHSGMHGVQWNGRVTGLEVVGNVIHSNNYTGISLINGVCDSVIRGNLIFNNSRQGIIFHCYDDTPTSGIVAYDQTGNIVADNIIWLGKTSWKGDAQTPKDHAAVEFSDVTAAQEITYTGTVVGGNTLATQSGIGVKLSRFADAVTLDGNQEYVGDDPPFADVSIDYWNQPSRFDFRSK